MRDMTCDICGKKIQIEIQDNKILPSSEFRTAGIVRDICPACTGYLWTAINSRKSAFEEECFVPVHEHYNCNTYVPIKTIPPTTPEQFKQNVEAVLSKPDVEMNHIATDRLMEDMLCQLGYWEGVDLIQKQTRWYA